MDRIDLFRVFTRVVETASFTRAADTLGMPRSTVSNAVQMLEERIGTRLLHRTTRHVAPTLDGTAFYERCMRLIDDMEDVENLFRQKEDKPTGRLRIDVPGRIGRKIIAPALPDFLRMYPDIEIELGVTDRTVNLIEERIDCALRVGALHDSSVIARSLGVLTLVNVASPAYVAQYGMPLLPKDLEHHWSVNYASPTTARKEPWEWVESGQLKTMPIKSRVTVNNAETYIACCLAGLGLIQVPAYDVKPYIAQKRLIEVLPDYCAEPMPMALLYPHRRHLSRRVRVFTDWLEPLLKKGVGI